MSKHFHSRLIVVFIALIVTMPINGSSSCSQNWVSGRRRYRFLKERLCSRWNLKFCNQPQWKTHTLPSQFISIGPISHNSSNLWLYKIRHKNSLQNPTRQNQQSFFAWQVSEVSSLISNVGTTSFYRSTICAKKYYIHLPK